MAFIWDANVIHGTPALIKVELQKSKPLIAVRIFKCLLSESLEGTVYFTSLTNCVLGCHEKVDCTVKGSAVLKEITYDHKRLVKECTAIRHLEHSSDSCLMV